MERQFIKLSEGNIAYVSAGQGPPILLLHSLGVSCDAWDQVMGPLAQRWAVHAPDMMGHGYSDRPPRNYLIKDYAQNVIDFTDNLGLDRVILCGNSVGALIAVETAASHPDRVSALILVGCPAWDAWGRIERLMLSALSYDIQGNPILATRENLSVSYAQVTPDLVNWVNKQRAMAGQWMKKTMVAIGLFDVMPKLSFIKCPTLVVFGEKDFLREREKVLLQQIPGAKYALIPDSGHLPQMDNPGSFVEAVTQFIKV